MNVPRRLLLINPNTTEAVTHFMADHLRAASPAAAQWTAVTAAFGAPYIACEASHAVAGHAVLDAWQAALGERDPANAFDAVLIGCFGDPGLFALRECSAVPVTGLAEAAFIEAARQGPFAVVTGGQRWKPMLQRLAGSLGFGAQLRHIETVVPTGAALQADPDMAIRCLTQACQQAAQSGVAAIILGGAGLAGYARLLQPHIPLPLIDSALAGLQVMLHPTTLSTPHAQDGFFAQWQGMPENFKAIPSRAQG